MIKNATDGNFVREYQYDTETLEWLIQLLNWIENVLILIHNIICDL